MPVGRRQIFPPNIEVMVDSHGCKCQNIIPKELTKLY